MHPIRRPCDEYIPDPGLAEAALGIPGDLVRVAVSAFESVYYGYAPEIATEMAMRFALAALDDAAAATH